MMPPSDQFLLALQAYQEIREEIRLKNPDLSLENEIQELHQSIPGESLLLGLGENGVPILINLFDPGLGPLLIAGDGGSGKTALLQSLAIHSNSLLDTQFGVITPFVDEWNAFDSYPNNLGIWPAYHPSVNNFLSQLVHWAGILGQTRQAILLLVDGLDLMALDSAGRFNLRWLLCHGPENQIWPFITLNPGHTRFPLSLLDNFHNRIFGHIRRYRTACQVTGEQDLNLASLVPGIQFLFMTTQECFPFWLPPNDGGSYERGNALVRQ